MELLWNYILHIFSFDPNSPLLFTQFQFWAFFAMVFALFSLTGKRTLLRNSYLFFVSLLFYYKTSGLFVGLLILVTISDFFIAKKIYKSSAQWKRRALLCLSVTIDLGILCYFKYSYFFADVFGQICHTHFQVKNIAAMAGNAITGSNVFSVDKIILPVGISFYTFQIISYTADVYKGLVKPVRNILNFGFYVSFFPQLVAGPIIKASDFIPQLYKKYNLTKMQFGIAVFWILNGLVKKIVLSDYLAVNFIDRIFDNPHLFGGFETVCALFLYSLQVYADFSGYTDIAIGLSLLMGFHLPMNFNSPYKAQNCGNFWKRWHISLSRWLQTYLYIPLGGNRNSTFGTYFFVIVLSLSALILSGSWWVGGALLSIAGLTLFTAYRYPERRKKIYANLNNIITMLLGGMWHGASMNFIIWGGLNGIGNIVYKFWRDSSNMKRATFCTAVTFILFDLILVMPLPLWNVLIVFMGFISVSTWIRYAWEKWSPLLHHSSFILHHSSFILHPSSFIPHPSSLIPHLQKYIARSWAITVTFTFITFTRLFFRSGSNLDPATANATAWKTASEMVNAMGTRWSVNIWDVISAYHNVFLLFVIGMIIHWLPTNTKRRYRIWFAKLPVPVICLICIITVFFTYQFVTAKMQPFIYFQF